MKWLIFILLCVGELMLICDIVRYLKEHEFILMILSAIICVLIGDLMYHYYFEVLLI
jgi:hypothetical protein